MMPHEDDVENVFCALVDYPYMMFVFVFACVCVTFDPSRGVVDIDREDEKLC